MIVLIANCKVNDTLYLYKAEWFSIQRIFVEQKINLQLVL